MKCRFAQQITALLDSNTRSLLTTVPHAHSLIDAALDTAMQTSNFDIIASEQLAQYMAERFPHGANLERMLKNWHVGDLCLCYACMQGDNRALATLQTQCIPVIRAKLRRMNITAPLSQDIEQILMDRLLVGNEQRIPALARYTGTGRLHAWLRVVVARTARRVLDRENWLCPVDDDLLAKKVVDNDSRFDMRRAKEEYRLAFKKSFKQALAQLPSRDAAVLRHRHVDGLGLEHIGAIYRVHHATVHRWLSGIRQRLLDNTELILMRELRIDQQECKSIIRLIQSDFDMTLHTFLNYPGD